MSETMTYNAAGFSLKSSWKDGSTPSTDKRTITITVSGIPDGATIDSATFSCVFGSPSTGAQTLKVNNVSASTSSTFTYNPSVTGNGSYSFAFSFRANGSSASGSHMGTVSVSNISLVVVYTGAEPSDDPEGDVDAYDYPDSHNICVYAPDDEDFTTNGLGILDPISCIVTEEAGGQYELELKLAANGDVWKLIQCESIIKSPVPLVVIEDFQQSGVAYWKVKSTQSGVPVMSKVPTITRTSSTNYPAWSSSNDYVAGDKVSYNSKGWQYIGPDTARLGITTVAPGSAGYWVDLNDSNTKVNSGKTLAKLARNEVFTKLADINTNWIRIKTVNGVTGYIEKKYAELYSTDVSFVQGREIRQQCFRVYHIEKDASTMTVTINARHISYDFAKTYLGKCEAKTVTVPTAIALIEGAEIEEDNRHIYTDISDTKCDLDCSWDNGVTALLNPDAGVVAQLQAKLVRDNEDFFILKDEHDDNGFRIEYGNNLKALKWSTDTSSMVTRVVPHCKDASDNDLMLPELWVDSPLLENYPAVYIEALAVNCKVGAKGTLPDGTEVNSLTKAQCREIMRAEAEKRFSVDHADEPEVTIDVDLVMLGATVEYSHIAPLEILFMYDTVHIKHPILNLDITAYMTGYEYDAVLRRYTKITLTNARRRIDTSVSGFDLRDNSIRFEKLSSTAVDRLRA